MKKYAKVIWTVDDVATIRPDWTEEQCEKFLQDNEKRFQELMVQEGWQIMECLAQYNEDEN